MMTPANSRRRIGPSWSIRTGADHLSSMLIPEGTAFIYFIQAGGNDGPIKIGRAKDPLARLADLQVANHERLRLLMTIADNGTLEMQLHKRFESLRIHGEWFRCEGDLEDVLWLSGLVPHPETVREIEEHQAIELVRNRPWPSLAADAPDPATADRQSSVPSP